MVHLRLGHSFLAALFLLPAALGFLAMLTIALTQRSGLAAGGALLFLGIGGQLLRMLRRRQQDAPEAVVHRGAQGAVATSLPAFVTFARHSRGPWTQKGVVVVGDGCAVFLPMGGPSHLALDIVMTLAGPSLRFADIGIDLGGTTPAAMAAAAEEHGGFLLTSDWTWHASQRWLRRHEADGIVVLEKAPPEERMRHYPAARAPTRAETLQALRKILPIGLGAGALLLGAGAAGTAWTGNVDIVIGLGAWGALVSGATVAAAVIVLRQRKD